jgi:molybdopterin converting factor small subunit
MLRPERLVLEMEVKKGLTVKDLLNHVARKHRKFVEAAFDFEKQKLTGEMAIVLNGHLLKALETKITDGDVVMIIPILAGG